MPEPTQPPTDPEATPLKAKAKSKKPSSTDKLQEIKDKYQVERQTNLREPGANRVPMGLGPHIDPQVFNKLAELDTSKNKRYLDWMLFQAGGGAAAFKKSRDNWGDGTKEITPEEFFEKFKSQHPQSEVAAPELRDLATKIRAALGLNVNGLLEFSDDIRRITSLPEPAERFTKLVELITHNHIAPGNESKLALEIIGNKFKAWIKQQIGTKTRDRIHATVVYSRMIRGADRATAEAKWKELEPKQRREYLNGDDDMKKWESFSFSRHWPGHNNAYETVYNVMKQFLKNKQHVEEYNERLEDYNTKIKAKNANLSPEAQLPLRQSVSISLDIGKVLMDANFNLTYRGPYPTVKSLAQANEQIEELPMRERISQDISYAGPKGRRSKTEKLYTDEFVEALVPLTVAAAIQAGKEEWDVSNPDQLNSVKSKGPFSHTEWTKRLTGQHGYAGWNGSAAITVFFNIKVPMLPTAWQRLYMTVFQDDLVDLTPPYGSTEWKAGGDSRSMKFTEVLRFMKKHLATPDAKPTYLGIVRGLGNAMKAIRDWGAEFDPKEHVVDYVSHHRQKLQGKRTLGEDVAIRAAQVVQALCD